MGQISKDLSTREILKKKRNVARVNYLIGAFVSAATGNRDVVGRGFSTGELVKPDKVWVKDEGVTMLLACEGRHSSFSLGYSFLLLI